MSEALYQSLPASLHELVDVVGLTAALRLVESHGGIRLYVPERIPDRHPLVEAIGRAAADELARHFGREHLPLPRCAQLLRDRRDREIRTRYEKGESGPRLARAYHLTLRHVRRILAADASNDDDDGTQGTLF